MYYNYFNNNYATPDYPVIPIVSINNKIKNYSYQRIVFNQPQLIMPDEIFVNIVHSPITPNVMQDRYMVSNYGRVWDKCYNNFLANSTNDRGYYRVKLAYCTNSSTFKLAAYDVYLHRLVGFFFLYFPGCENLEINHKDGNKAVNIYWNLEWCTPEYNKLHAKMNGLILSGEDSSNALLTNDQADKVGQLIYQGKSNIEIEEILGIPANIVSNIRCGKSYKFVSIKYNTTETVKKIRSKLTDDEVHKICRLRMDGYTISKIAEIVGCKEHQVSDLLYNDKNFKKQKSIYKLSEAKRPKKGDLTDDVVEVICKRLVAGESCAQITKDMNLRRDIVSEIKRGKYYTHISNKYPEILNYTPPTKLTEEQAERICILLEKGVSTKELSIMFNCSSDKINHIKYGTSFSKIRSNHPKIDEMIKEVEKPLEEFIVRKICVEIAKNPDETSRSIAKKFNVDENIVQRIRRKETFKNISDIFF